ncbi:MAG: hypothetical protein J5699_05115 [Bacteroidales bacterium]|nr:hypothetical protein [Bacteroidales bacterium]
MRIRYKWLINSVVFAIASFIICGCDGFLIYHGWKDDPNYHKVIEFENNSDSELFVDHYFPPAGSTYNYMLSRCIIGALDRSFIKSGETSKDALYIRQYEWGKNNYWEWEFEQSEYDYVYIIIADAKKVRQRIADGKKYGEYSYDYEQWPEESQESPLLAIYMVTLEDLNSLDWKLSYPPDVSMRPESIIQRQ